MGSLRQSIFGAIMLVASNASAAHVWINEFHYDNDGGDVGEFVEVALRTPIGSGFNASDYIIEFYNGSNGELYESTGPLSSFDTIVPFPVVGSTDTITLYSQQVDGIQNGAPDGLALVNTSTVSVESFLSYEGAFAAVTGTAAGMTSTDVGVDETGAALLTSLSATGSGSTAADFGADSFALTEIQTPGAINIGQSFTASAVPEPSGLLALAASGIAFAGYRQRRRRGNIAGCVGDPLT